MKKLGLLLVVIFFVLTSCETEDYSNSVRIRNSSSAVATNCIVAGVSFGNIGISETSEYKEVPGGENDLTGGLQGTITLPEDKTLSKDRKWTLIVNANFSLSIEED